LAGVNAAACVEFDYGLFAWICDPEGNRIELRQNLPLAKSTST
jgi:predicted enzyme related to lactoylglutathione lyase